MSPSHREIADTRSVKIITVVLIIIVALVVISILAPGGNDNQRLDEKYLRSNSSYSTQNSNVLNYLFCQNCQTIIPCPDYQSGMNPVYPNCPSCGLKMDYVRNRSSQFQYDYGPQGFNVEGGRGMGGGYGRQGFNVAGGRGMGGGSGLGPGGSLICPQCGYTEPHQRGVPCYSVQCPRCGAIMTRQTPAGLTTMFLKNNNSNVNNSVASAAPPITSNAPLPHEYRGVCSKCHKIVYSSAGMR